jgi:hypothetical protein
MSFGKHTKNQQQDKQTLIGDQLQEVELLSKTSGG